MSRAVAIALAMGLTGCSFLMAPRRLQPNRPPAAAQCSTNAYLPSTDVALAVVGLAAAIGFAAEGASDDPGEGGTDLSEVYYAWGATSLVASGVFAYAAYKGFSWHRACRRALAR